MSSKAKTILACVACLVIGYFIGREHIKYQMRSAMQDAVKTMQEGISSAFGGNAGTPPEPKKQQKAEDQPIVATLLKKGFSPSDIHNGKFEEQVTMTVSFSNKTGKEIRAFDGTLEFTDLLGNTVIASRVEINEPIALNGTYDWEGSLEYNQFMNDHERLRSESKENLKAVMHVGKVLFSDGTTKEYE